MNSRTLLAIIAVVVATTTTSLHAVTISQWTFETSVSTPANVAPHASASSFALSSGAITYFGGNAPTAVSGISGTGWNVVDGVRWWEFTVTADPGYTLNLSSLTFDDRASSTGAKNWSLTINGVSAVLNQAVHTDFSTSPMNTVDLSAASFQGLTSANVKIFGFGASGSTGTWRLDNVTLEGTITPSTSVPETLPFIFTACFLLGFLSFAHKISGMKQLAGTKPSQNQLFPIALQSAHFAVRFFFPIANLQSSILHKFASIRVIRVKT